MSENLKRAQGLLEIINISLVDSRINYYLNDPIEMLDQQGTFTQTYRNIKRIEESEGRSEVDEEESITHWLYYYTYSVGVRLARPPNTEGQNTESDVEEDIDSILEITADYQAKYMSIEKLSEEEVKAFSKNNVGYHVWPFWREYIQSTCARMNLYPALSVPMYTLSKNATETMATQGDPNQQGESAS